MKSHLKPLFIKAKAEGKIIKRVLADGGAAVNLILEYVVIKMDKTCSDLMPHNMVITDFNEKTSTSPGCIVLDLKVGSIIRTTMFIVVPSKANYNLRLGREWIHGVGVVPSTLYQMMFMWDEESQLKFIRVMKITFKVKLTMQILTIIYQAFRPWTSLIKKTSM